MLGLSLGERVGVRGKQRRQFKLVKKRVKQFLFLILFFLFLLCLAGCGKESKPIFLSSQQSCSVYFSPQDLLYPHLIYLFQEARESIYAAFYKIELKEILEALVKAHKRGVKVKIFTDDLTFKDKGSQFNYFDKFHLVRTDKAPESFMHHKFCVIDEKIIWTGSFNPTPAGSFKENNNVVIIRAPSLAVQFIKEFKRLWEGKPEVSDFPRFYVLSDGTRLKVYFSLCDNLEEAIIEELEKAEKSIHFALFTFTSKKIAQTLIDKFAENLEIKGILEKDQDSLFSQYYSLKRLKIPVRWDRNFYFMHHKFFIIDKKVVITGSFNPTWHANYQNRENLLIIYNFSLAGQYEKEFNKLWRKSYFD